MTSPLLRAMMRRVAKLASKRLSKQQTLAQPMTEYRDRPVEFCWDILGVRLWAGQVQIIEGLRDNPRVSVAACFASGKTFTAACVVLWWLMTRRPALVVTTAPTGRQVRTLLWRDVRKLFKRAKVKLPGRALQVRLEIAEDWLAWGQTGDDQNAVAGVHEAENVLFIEDEAAGMSAEIIEGFEGITATEGSRHLKIGNPICQSGPFFDSHVNPEERERWVRISIDAEDTPNVIAGKTVVPGLVSREWVEDKRKRWLRKGLLHLWNTRVKGKFFLTSTELVIPPHWAAAAQARWGQVPTDGIRVLGVDVAGGGQDESVAYLRTGRQLRWVDAWQDEDLMRQARRIVNLCIELHVQRVCIDRTGLGQGIWSRVVQIVEEEGLNLEVVGVALQKAAKDSETYNRLTDEIQFLLRWALDPTNPEAVAIDPADTQLAAEICLRSWWKNDSNKVQCEGKRDLKKRGVPSPDRGDAASLTFVEGEAIWWG